MTETVITGTSAAALSTFAPELSNENGQITTTSLQIAEHFGKRHDTVLRAIRNLGCSDEFRLRNFAASSYLNEQGKQHPMFHITKDGFVFLAMGFTGKEADQWKEAYIGAFNKMEAALTAPALPQSITPAQAQHLRELVQLVVESGKQGHGETWARLHRKLKVNSYLALHPDQFDAACKYLRTKMDDASIAAIAQKHFPQIAQLSAPQHEEPKMPFDITSACAFILGGMFDPRAVAALADACGRVLFRVAVNSDQGPGREIANKIKTLGAADLYAVHVAVAMEAHLRTSPQRVAT